MIKLDPVAFEVQADAFMNIHTQGLKENLKDMGHSVPSWALPK